MSFRTIILMLLISGFQLRGWAQHTALGFQAETSFLTARELAYNGNNEAARDTLRHILTKDTRQIEVLNLMAKTYSWDGAYDEARKRFNRITSAERYHQEVWVAAINNERFAGNLSVALGLTNKALLYLRGDTTLTALRSKLISEIENRDLSRKEEGSPEMEKTGESLAYKNQFGIINTFDIYDIAYDPMVGSGLEYVRETGIGKLLARINYANRFQINGLQYELDFYPRLSNMLHGYLNYGYSDAPIFPVHRMGAELYASVSKAFETSFGIRHLEFDNGDATIYTASLGWYKGNYYANLRSYLSPGKGRITGYSGTFVLRKYLRDKENYLGVQLGFGFAPELKQLMANGTLLAETLLYLESEQLQLEYQFSPGKQPSIYKAMLGITRQELAFDSGTFFWALSAGLRYHVKF